MAGVAFDYKGKMEKLFKDLWIGMSENAYNSATPLLGRVKKSYNFVGKKQFIASPLSRKGGYGAGTLPTSNSASMDLLTIESKKMYQRALIDRESIAAAMNDGALRDAMKYEVEKSVENFNNNMSRVLFGDGTALLALGAGATNVTGAGTSVSPYVCKLAATTNESNIEENEYVNYDTETTLLEVVAFDPSTMLVSLVGTSTGLAALSGANPVPSNKGFYAQGSKDLEPIGLKGVCDATSGSLYGITVQRRWKATQVDAAALPLTLDMMNQVVSEMERKVGVGPDMIVTSYTQHLKLKNLLEDKKYITIQPREQKLQGVISFSGIAFDSERGIIPVFADRFCDADRMYFLNTDHIEIHHRPKFGWFNDDGTIFMRVTDEDEYEARYGGYLQIVIAPTWQGVLKNLSIA